MTVATKGKSVGKKSASSSRYRTIKTPRIQSTTKLSRLRKAVTGAFKEAGIAKQK